MHADPGHVIDKLREDLTYAGPEMYDRLWENAKMNLRILFEDSTRETAP